MNLAPLIRHLLHTFSIKSAYSKEGRISALALPTTMTKEDGREERRYWGEKTLSIYIM